jgi:hypothetical protein
VADQGGTADPASVEGLKQIPQVTLDVPGRLAPRIAVTTKIDGGNRVPALREVFSELREDPPVLPNPVDANNTFPPWPTPVVRVEDHLSGSP